MNKQKILKKLSNIFSEEYPKYYKSKLAFSGACDVDEKTIRRILKGEQNISIWIFLKLCEAVKLNPSDVLKKINNES